MANNTNIFRRKKDISQEELQTVLNEINKEIFDGLLPITIVNDYTEVCKSVDKNSWEKIEIRFEKAEYLSYEKDDLGEKVANTYIDIRQGHSTKFYWWLDHLLICEISNRLDAEIEGEGFYEKPENGYEYTKSFNDSVNRHWRKKTIFNYFYRRGVRNRDLKYAKLDLSKKLFKKVMSL